MHLPAVLTGLLGVAMVADFMRGMLRPSISVFTGLQWMLWVWAGITRLISDGVASLSKYLTDDYTKDVVFATLIATICDTVSRLRWLARLFVAVMTFISYITISQHDGPKKCYHFKHAWE